MAVKKLEAIGEMPICPDGRVKRLCVAVILDTTSTATLIALASIVHGIWRQVLGTVAIHPW